MTPDAGYGALYWLHSVLNVPEPARAEFTPTTFYHKSFQDYLRNTEKSGMPSSDREKQEKRTMSIADSEGCA